MSLESVQKERRQRWEIILIVIMVGLVVNLLATAVYLNLGLQYLAPGAVIPGLALLLILFIVMVFRRLYVHGGAAKKQFKAVIGWDSKDQKLLSDLWGYRLYHLAQEAFEILGSDTAGTAKRKLENNDGEIDKDFWVILMEYVILLLCSRDYLLRPGYDRRYEVRSVHEDVKMGPKLAFEGVYIQRDLKSETITSVRTKPEDMPNEYFTLRLPRGSTCQVRRYLDDLRRTEIEIRHKFFLLVVDFSWAGSSRQLAGLHPVVALTPLSKRYHWKCHYCELHIEGRLSTWLFLTRLGDCYYRWVESFIKELEASTSWDYFSTFLPNRKEVELRQLLARFEGKLPDPYRPDDIGDMTHTLKG